MTTRLIPDEQIDMTFGVWLKARRQAKGMTPAELSRLAGMRVMRLRGLERGTSGRGISAKELSRVTAVLNLDASEARTVAAAGLPVDAPCRSCETNRTGKCRAHRGPAVACAVCKAEFSPRELGKRTCGPCAWTAKRRVQGDGGYE